MHRSPFFRSGLALSLALGSTHAFAQPAANPASQSSIAATTGTSETAPVPGSDWQTAREGTHFGLGLGAAYLPINDGISAGFLTLNLNVGLGQNDFRLTAGLGTVSGKTGSEEWTATTLFLAPQYQLNFGSVYSMSFGPLVGLYFYDGGETYTTPILGPTASPAIFRFGASRQMEIGLTVFAVRNFHEDNVTPGGYASFTYLFL
jgi:hypothetical protein